jgi:hypothetical protein
MSTSIVLALVPNVKERFHRLLRIEDADFAHSDRAMSSAEVPIGGSRELGRSPELMDLRAVHT